MEVKYVSREVRYMEIKKIKQKITGAKSFIDNHS